MTPVYVVTDIEVDGPNPGENSMLSFASVAVNANGMEINEFEAVLAPLDGATSDPDTMAWFKNYPDAFAAATHNPLPAKDVIKSYIDWVHGLPGKPIFASHPMAFDGMWMDHYLRAFAGIRLTKGPWSGRRLFHAGGLCLRSFAAGKLGWPLWDCVAEQYPSDWMGYHEHSHHAIDDARGYASLLITLMTGPE